MCKPHTSPIACCRNDRGRPQNPSYLIWLRAITISSIACAGTSHPRTDSSSSTPRHPFWGLAYSCSCSVSLRPIVHALLEEGWNAYVHNLGNRLGERDMSRSGRAPVLSPRWPGSGGDPHGVRGRRVELTLRPRALRLGARPRPALECALLDWRHHSENTEGAERIPPTGIRWVF